MLTLYKTPRGEDSDSSSSRSSSDSDDESVYSRRIPAGRPYITKVRGKLVMAREKRERRADVVVDLLGEAFGPKTRIIRRRSKSLDPEKGPLIINGITYVPQPPTPIPYSVPIPQQRFQALAPMPPYVTPEYAQPYPQPHYPGPVQTYLVEHPKPEPRPQRRTESKPSKEELAKLVDMDEHFHKTSGQVLKTLDPSPPQQEKEKIIATTTTITIVKHVCANCGRLRSRKYHHEHPIKEGDVPAPAFCRKCQRDVSSTTEPSEDDREEYRRKKKEKSRKSKKHKSKEKKKKTEISSSEDTPTSKHGKEQEKTEPAPSKKQEGIPFDPREDYIVVEEELSEEDPKPRGRKREKPVVEEYHGPSRSHSALDLRAYPRRAHSAAERQESVHAANARANYHRQRSPSRDYIRDEDHPRHNDSGFEETVGGKASVISLTDEVRYEGPVPVTRGLQSEDESTHPKKIPVRYVEGVRRPIAKEPALHNAENEDNLQACEYSVEEVKSISARSHGRHDNFEERSSSTRQYPDWDRAARDHSAFSSRSSEARRRRRRERATPNFRPWEAPRAIDPDVDADVVVVTEGYGYRRSHHDEETRRTQEYANKMQEYIDRATLGAHHETRRFSPEDAARYFHNDWSEPEPTVPAPAPVKKSPPPKQSFRRDSFRAPSSSSESSYDYTISRVGNPLPRVPTPPSSRPEAHHWESVSEHSEHSRPEIPHQRVEREVLRAAQGSRQSERPRSTSTSRRAQAPKTPSPRQREVREHLTVVSEGSVASGMTERERMVERMAELGARHVTFRDTPSERSATAWLSSFSSSPEKHHPHFGEGWDNGDSRGNGSQW